jgi:L-seryl-tRNA(Ser) seleniumtransferase
VGADTGIVVKVHRSNFALSGFVAEASALELGTFAVERGIPLLHDLGSGLLVSLEVYGLSGEPTARDAVTDAGPNGLVTMSGDKLLGGPQAGIILGSTVFLDRIRKNPLTRSYRVDKLTLAALEATLAVYRWPSRAVSEIPALAQLTCDVDDLRRRAETLRANVDSPRVSVVESEATVGGGAFPTARIPSAGLAIDGDAARIENALRAGDPPIIARVADARVVIDLRSVFPGEDSLVAVALRAALE